MKTSFCIVAVCAALSTRAGVLRTETAEFQISPSGAVRAYLLKGAERLSLDAADTADVVRVNGSRVTFDEGQEATSAARNSYGADGWRLESRQGAGTIERAVTYETYKDFPALLIISATYRNRGSKPAELEVTTDNHHFHDPAGQTLWSFQGGSENWGEDDIAPLKAGLHRDNRLGESLPNGNGGGVPVVAVWNARVGEATGHLETLPLSLSIPVIVDARGNADTRVVLPPVTLAAGESWASPRTFLMVYSGDYYEPLRMYSQVLQRQGWKLPKPSEEAYSASWCGWGYGFNVNSKDMLSVIPKLKEFGIKWATLDDRWFQTYGDWNPRPDTFPGNSLRDLVRAYHRNGIYAQLWWLPIGVEYPGARTESHVYIEAQVVKDHPDWLILDKQGKPARMTRNLAALCPAVPGVQDYHRRLTERFIRDWDFDGHKLDNIFSVPLCYNPKHHHKSPQDSVNAMGEVYRVIYETTRRLKPQSVTQSCPCGTPPNIAWLPYMDQAVTADPINSIQVRRRIKMYKALLGPEAPVYGDHVELTDNPGRPEPTDKGRDFASTVGVGGVPGTKFVWPGAGVKAQEVVLDAAKEREWKKWMELYRAKMLSRGEFRDLYVTGFDKPEGYAIEKNGRIYYAFFAGLPADSWDGRVELRGLAPGRWRVSDYVNNRSLGEVDSDKPFVYAPFTGSLLLQATPVGQTAGAARHK